MNIPELIKEAHDNELFDFNNAVFSECRNYRYELWRWWDESKSFVMFIGLNPSTANETNNDPTIRRCIGFAQKWGYGGLCMTNLFAIRTKDPKIMKRHLEPIGIDNDEHLIMISDKAGKIVAAWGIDGGYKNRDIEVISFIPNMYCLGITKHGFPKHPLFLSKDIKLELFYTGRNIK